MDLNEYKLSASLEEHEDDVRGVAFPNPKLVISTSRDSTVRLWKFLSPNPLKYECSISSHGASFINAVTYLRPTTEYPEGLVISGGKDTIIEVRRPGNPPEADAEALLLGHSHNVCALDTSPDGDFVVSGSWDGSARVWKVGKWECEALLEGHEGSVWAVLAYDRKIIVTGCADRLIRIFDVSSKLLRTIKGATDVVRALCRISPDHQSKADFASAGNDALIRLWRFDGKQVGELQGHGSYIYSLVSLPNGELISSGEDRTVRIWKNLECIQTITHPAISVWGVAACEENGDIVSGASDKKVRIFSRVIERQAEPSVIKGFEESVKSSSIPQQQVEDINKEKLPGPEFLQQKSGTKEGQVVMIQERDGSVSAHQWSQGPQRWMNVGTVVDAVGSSGKKIDFLGRSYDYVFDVDIEDGKPPLKLPYDLSQNPYEAATKFIQDNELPITYLDQVANFIISNTKGTLIGQNSQSEPAGADPWGTESRYRPGEGATTSAPAPSGSPVRPKVLPQTTYLSIKTASLHTILKKISELNQRLVNEGSGNLALSPAQLSVLNTAAKPLEQALSSSSSSSDAITESIPIILHIATAWPPADRLPGLDLFRLMTAVSPVSATYSTSGRESVIDVLAASGVFDDLERPNNIMLAIRAFSNLFETAQGRDLADTNFEKLHSLIKPCASAKANRNLTIAITTLYLNFATFFTSTLYSSLPSSIDRSLKLMDDLAQFSAAFPDSEAVYRALVAAGTLLTLGEEIRMAAREVYDLEAAIDKAEIRLKEPRVKGVVAEIKALLSKKED